LHVEDVGEHGLFCCLTVETVGVDDYLHEGGATVEPRLSISSNASDRGGDKDDDALARGSAANSVLDFVRPLMRRRWVQLRKSPNDEHPCFEIYRTRPSQELDPADEQVGVAGAVASRGHVGGANSSRALQRDSLDYLKDATFHGARTLTLAFGSFEGRTLRVCCLKFDCPSQAYRWRQILQSWWASEEMPPMARNIASIKPRRDATVQNTPPRSPQLPRPPPVPLPMHLLGGGSMIGPARNSPLVQLPPQSRRGTSPVSSAKDLTRAASPPPPDGGVTFSSAASLWVAMASQPSREVLEVRLGGLWKEVQQVLKEAKTL
jgi:hypothetical protein